MYDDLRFVAHPVCIDFISRSISVFDLYFHYQKYLIIINMSQKLAQTPVMDVGVMQLLSVQKTNNHYL